MPTTSIRPCRRLALASILALAAAVPGAHPAAASPQASRRGEAAARAQALKAQADASRQPTASARSASVSLPDSRPGLLMAEWLALCDKPDPEQMTRWYRAHLWKGSKGEIAKAAAAKDVARCEAAGGYQVTQVQVDEASQLAVFAVGRRSDTRSRLTLALDAEGRIAAPQPAAADTPASAPAPAGITGSWAGTAVLEDAFGDTRLVRMEAELKAEGARVSGSVTLSPPPGPSAPGQLPLSGAVAGNRLTFSAERTVVVYLFDLAIVSPDRIEGSVTSDSHGEQQSTGKVVFIRSGK